LINKEKIIRILSCPDGRAITSHKIRELISSNKEFRAYRENQIFSLNNDMSDLWRISHDEI